LITLLNGVCGFAAIAFAGNGDFAKAGYMVFLAMLADMLDGRVARMSQSTSSFGGQLDSLCDMISFGVAPAFLMLKVMECKLTLLTHQMVQSTNVLPVFLQRFIWLTAAISPASAGVIVSLIIFYQNMLPNLARKSSPLYNLSEGAIVYSLPFIALGVSFLMISRIRYPHILNQYLRGTKPFAHLIRAVVFIVLIIINFEAALVFIFLGFALSGLLKWSYYKLRAKKAIHKAFAHPHVITTLDSN
jgi:CDP-diacylglycerol--serine O-phosphatidyltransferase